MIQGTFPPKSSWLGLRTLLSFRRRKQRWCLSLGISFVLYGLDSIHYHENQHFAFQVNPGDLENLNCLWRKAHSSSRASSCSRVSLLEGPEIITKCRLWVVFAFSNSVPLGIVPTQRLWRRGCCVNLRRPGGLEGVREPREWCPPVASKVTVPFPGPGCPHLERSLSGYDRLLPNQNELGWVAHSWGEESLVKDNLLVFPC